MKSKKMNTLVKFLIKTILVFCLSLGFVNQTKAQSLLWKISGNGLEKPSYIYGTMHLICPDDFQISDALKEVFDNTDQVVLEVDLDAPDFMQKVQRLSMNPGMKNISSELSEDDKKIINDFLEKHFKVNLMQLGTLKPFLLQIMIAPKLYSCPQPIAYEQTFLQLAKEQKEEVLGLEEVEEQFAIFDNIPQKKQLEWLVEYIKDTEKAKIEMQNLLDAYKKEDLNGIQEIILKNPEFQEEYLDIMFVNRNKKWISKIKTYAEEKPSFFAVGAGHLPGKNGVLELLQKQGYTLTPVKQ